MSQNFVERAWHFFYERGDDYEVYPILNEQERVTGFWNGPVAPEGVQRNLTSCGDPKFDAILDSAGDK